MPHEPQSDNERLWELAAAHTAAADEIALNDRAYQAVEAALGRIAREHYPGIGDWDSAQLRQVAGCISRHASRFTLELSDLASAATRGKEFA